MKTNRQDPDAAKRGMTLVELMVAIMIAGIMGTMMYQVVVITGRANKRDGGRIVRSMQARVYLHRICQDLQSVVSPDVSGGIGLLGTDDKIDDVDADTVLFTRAYFSGSGPEAKITLKEMSYGIKKVSTKNGFYTTLITKEDDQTDGKIDAPEQSLGENPNHKVRLNLRYRADGKVQSDKGWRNAWQAEAPLPEAIEVTLEMIDPLGTQGTDKVNRVVLSRVVRPKSATLF